MRKFLLSQGVQNAHWGIILGSGLGNVLNEALNEKIEIPYSEIPGFPVSTVQGHAGKLVYTELFEKKVLIFQGRFHYYEGYKYSDLVKPVVLMNEMNVKNFLVTNAAGGANHYFKPGTIMLIRDYINFIGFRHTAKEKLFMGNALDKNLGDQIIDIAANEGLHIKEGTLFGNTGPTYETLAEVRMVKKLGGDALSMSTIPEITEANKCGIRTAGFSMITNKNPEFTPVLTDHSEVVDVASKISARAKKLILAIIKNVK